MVAERVATIPPLAVIQTEQAERHLSAFIAQAWHVVEPATPYQANWHIDAICLHLETLLAGVVRRQAGDTGEMSDAPIRNLLINMPPRMMKSLTVSVFFPAWVWIRHPWLRFLYSSYSQTLATEHSMLTRMVIESDWYQERWGDRFRLSGDDNLKTRFTNDRRGARLSTSVGGTVTGQGADIVVCDDPHNIKHAESDAIRAATCEWWDKVMSTRLNDPKTGARIIVMQRVHEHDLSGHVLAQGGYEHLSLPMEFEAATSAPTVIGWHDPRSMEGELLAPERFGRTEAADAKTRLGSYGYAGQMQQRPSPAEGGAFKREWWKFWTERPALEAFETIIQSWDMTFRETKAGSFVVGQVWGALGGDRYLLDQVRFRGDFPATVAAMRELSERWPLSREKLVENKANGPAVVSTLQHEIPGLIEVQPEGGKEARANAVSWQVEAGNVYLPDPKRYAWVSDFIEECATFPNGSHDDQVDALSQALVRLMPRGVDEPTVLPVVSRRVKDSRAARPRRSGW